MPLRKGESFGAAMHDLKHGPHHGQRTRAQEEAIAFKYSGEGRKKGRKKTRRRKR